METTVDRMEAEGSEAQGSLSAMRTAERTVNWVDMTKGTWAYAHTYTPSQ